VRFAPDCQMGVPPEFVEVGMRAVYHGHAGHYEYTADLRGAWERVDLRPIEIVDAGDRVAILGRLQIHARGSGVELESEAADVVWIDRGLIVRERVFLDWAAGLRAAEIPESAVTGSTLVGRPTTAVRLGPSDS